MGNVTAGEWRRVLIAGLLMMVLFSLPYFVGIDHSTSQMRFSGLLFALDDMNSYLAKMRFGAQNGWQFEIVYTARPHEGGYVYLHYLALGKLAAWVSGQGTSVTAQTLTITYHVARIVCGLLLLVVMYRFVAEFMQDPAQRLIAWLIAALGGGLGWILLIGAGSGVIHLPLEFYLPEGFTFLLLAGLPHLALARTGLLIGWIAVLRACDKPDWRFALAAGVAWLGMVLVVPFYAVLLGTLIVGWLIALGLSRRLFPLAELRLAAVAGLFPGLYLIYIMWLFSTNPVFAAWSVQNVLPSPPPLDYLLAYGILLIPATRAGVALWRAGLTHRSTLIVIWPVVAALLVYIPINVQRRLVEGVLLPLAVLAVMGVWPYLQRPGRVVLARRCALTVAGGALAVSPALFLMGAIITASRPAWPVYHNADELAALNWLADHAPPDSLVLSAPDSAMVLPVYAPVRVFTGDGPEAVNGAETRRAVMSFFSDGMSDDQRVHLLIGANIAYIWVGPPERLLMCDHPGCFAPSDSGLRQVYSQGDYVIYRVEGE